MRVRQRCSFPVAGCGRLRRVKTAQADKQTNAGETLRERFNYYCEKVVKGPAKIIFLRFDRQIVSWSTSMCNRLIAGRRRLICVSPCAVDAKFSLW